jgi:HAE1 family hydrophobic/amphiphilic exporter-1
MTSLATIIGMIPMALKLGEGAEQYTPMARAIIGGLTSSVTLDCIHRPGRVRAGIPE